MERSITLLTELNRMCDYYLENECVGCPFHDEKCMTLGLVLGYNTPEQIMEIVNTWSKYHPR